MTILNSMEANEPWRWDPARVDGEVILERAAIEDCEPVPSGSNYVFLLCLSDPGEGQGYAIYKPRRGEAPLWDFPDGTLYRRERAAYLVSKELGWDFIPPTIVRDGPYGIGMVQLFIPNNPRINFFSLRETHEPELRRMAVFDAITNNADRKGGHCLEGPDGKVWGIDHGLTFHESNKLRTVIWDYRGDTVEPELLADLQKLSARLGKQGPFVQALGELLHPVETGALRQRVELMIKKPIYPSPGLHRSVPWPPV